MATTIANASRPVTIASRQRGRHVSAVVFVASGGTTGGMAAAASAVGIGGGSPVSESAAGYVRGAGMGCCAAFVGWSVSCGAAIGAVIMRLTPGKEVCTAGTFLAVWATVSTGRRRNSETRATTTGVAAALTIVPAPQIREAANDAAADAMLAMIRVCSEMRPPSPLAFRSGLGGSEGSMTSA